MLDHELINVRVAGTPRARGEAHGEATRDAARDHLDKWMTSLATEVCDPISYLQTFLRETDFLPAIRRWTPELLAEVEGIASGIGAPFWQVFARQLSDEEPWFRRRWLRQRARAKGCSSIGLDATSNSPGVVAQNMDTPVWWRGHQTLLRIDPTKGPAALVFTVAGKISLCGMNEHGLAICCNTLSQLDYRIDGLPEDFVVRGYLAKRSVEDGLAFLRAIPHASGQNYTVPADRLGTVANLECSAWSIAFHRPWPAADRVFHTNHPLLNTDRELFRERDPDLARATQLGALDDSSHRRFAELQRRFGQPGKIVSFSDLAPALSAVERSGGDGGGREAYTLGSLIMTLGETPSLQVTPGPPSSTASVTFTF